MTSVTMFTFLRVDMIRKTFRKIVGNIRIIFAVIVVIFNSIDLVQLEKQAWSGFIKSGILNNSTCAKDSFLKFTSLVRSGSIAC